MRNKALLGGLAGLTILAVVGCGNANKNTGGTAPTKTTGNTTAPMAKGLPQSIAQNLMSIKYSSSQLAQIRSAAENVGVSAYIPSMVDVQGEDLSNSYSAGKHTLAIHFSNFILYESTSLDALAKTLKVSPSYLQKTKVTLSTGLQAWWGNRTSPQIPDNPLYVVVGNTHIAFAPGMNKGLSPQDSQGRFLIFEGMATKLYRVK